jgi:hemolysin III
LKPLLRGHFHQAMFFIALGAFIPLIVSTSTPVESISISIYAICTLTMLGISTLYHRITWSPEKRLLWKKLDHAGIYIMIAGTFTPIAMLALGGSSGEKILITIWVVAILGVIQSIFFVNVPKLVSSIIYLIAGYLIVPYVSELRVNIGNTIVWLIISGGLSYSLGALCYAFKRPVLNPKVFGYHEIFHIFVNIGAIIHFIVISTLIT